MPMRSFRHGLPSRPDPGGVVGKDEIVPGLDSKVPTDVRKVTIEGAGHFFADVHGEDAADAIAKFLTREPQVTK